MRSPFRASLSVFISLKCQRSHAALSFPLARFCFLQIKMPSGASTFPRRQSAAGRVRGRMRGRVRGRIRGRVRGRVHRYVRGCVRGRFENE